MKRATLDAGDYALEGWEDVSRLERKYRLRELYTNLFTKDRHRSANSFQRLAEACAYPYLLVESSPAQLYSERWPSSEGGAPPSVEAVLDRFCDLVTRYRLSIIWTGKLLSYRARTLTGDYVVRTMLRYVVQKELDR